MIWKNDYLNLNGRHSYHEQNDTKIYLRNGSTYYETVEAYYETVGKFCDSSQTKIVKFETDYTKIVHIGKQNVAYVGNNMCSHTNNFAQSYFRAFSTIMFY